jgi:hypothetical protein
MYMPRVMSRPTALLDGTPSAADIVKPNSDAERYHRQNSIFKKIPEFLGRISLLAHTKTPRMSGFVRVLEIDHSSIVAVGGETPEMGFPAPFYGFSINRGGDADFIQITRHTGFKSEDIQILAWADVKDPTKVVFHSPERFNVIDEPGKENELMQLLAIGEDATEWALQS